MTQEPFDPWRAAEACDDLILARHSIAGLMGGGLHVTRRGLGVIVIDPALGGADQRAVLTHELIHHERGGAVERADAPPSWQSVVEREERAVDREVAHRLVPPDELDRLIAEGRSIGDGVAAADVAARFEVPIWVASLALDRLAMRMGAAPAGMPPIDPR